MERLGLKKTATVLLVLVALPMAFLTCASAQRPRRVAGAPAAKTIMLRAGDDLQRALDAARPGDELVLAAGATFAGNFVLPSRAAAGAAYVTVRSSLSAELPEGRRVTPADAPRMAHLVSVGAGPVLAAPPGSSYFRFVGLEFTQGPAVREFSYGIVELGDGSGGGAQTTLAAVPHHFEFDRCLVRARDERTAAQRGISLNSAHTTVKNSHVSGIKWEGVETQAVGGWNGPGPFLIENNYLEAAGINVLFGGAVPAVRGLIPSDIVIRGNHLFKPLSWKQGDPSYAGRAWAVKNLLELKSARRVIIEGNVLEHSWAHAQIGWAVIFNTANDSGEWSRIEDVELRYNLIRGAGNGVNLRARDESSGVKMARVRVAHNLLLDLGPRWGGYGSAFQLLRGPEDVTIEHNTAEPPHAMLIFDAQEGELCANLRFNDNLLQHGTYGVFASGGAMGTSAFEQFCRRWSFAGNVIAGAETARYPARNFFVPKFGPKFFADPASGNYRVADPRLKGRATDGTDAGCDFAALEEALAWYLRPGPRAE